MAKVAAWVLLVLGIGHIIYGLVKFKSPLFAAVADGYIGQFGAPEVRRTTFWFMIFGPLLILAGHVGIHAAAHGDLALLKIVGIYTFATALLGVAAYPTSPFWGALVAAPVLIATGYKWLN